MYGIVGCFFLDVEIFKCILSLWSEIDMIEDRDISGGDVLYSRSYFFIVFEFYSLYFVFFDELNCGC